MADSSIDATECAEDPLGLAATGVAELAPHHPPNRSPNHPIAPDDSGDPDQAALPERIGRYLVLRKLGAGAMGVVVVAYDPELDRKLALKLIHPRVARRGEARTRMLREAKGLARLSHPNVVQIYDAGDSAGRVFIAMELVDGQPLSRWRAQLGDEASVDAILAVYLDAGRGLAAAHDAGLVHRDFKPDNVLVDGEGRAKVLDFGLVRAASGPSAEGLDSDDGEAAPERVHALAQTHASGGLTRSPDPSALDSDPALARVTRSELDLELTHGGQVMGTPAYMSPEQWLGRTADARSDQFSFCVAVWEALYGERPFAGETIPALAAAVDAGVVREPSGAVRVPRRVRRALARGLAREPSARFPDMHALLRELGREDWGPQRSLPLAVAALAAFGLLAWGRFAATPSVTAPTCDDAGAEVTQVWSPAAREAIRAAFAASEVAGAEAARLKIEADLDGYAARWAAAAQDNCAATRIRHQQSEALLDQRSRCLGDRLTELAALVEVLTRADAETVEEAALAVESLPSLRGCEPDQVGDAARLPDDPQRAEQVVAARRSLASARASLDTGRFREAGERLDALAAEVEAIDYPPLTAEYAVEAGRQLARSDRYQDAAAALQRGYFLATAHGDARLALVAAMWLAELEGAQRGRPEHAELWAQQAQALLDREPDRYPDIAADLADTRSWNAYLRDDLVAARAEAERGLAVLDQAQLAAPMRRVALLLDRGAAEYGAGQLDAAEASFEAALTLASDTLGRDNPKATGALNNLAITYMAKDEPERARALLEESVAVRERALGPDNVSVANGLSNLADVDIELGDGPAALAAAERAHRILAAALGPDQLATILAQQRLGLALAMVGRHGEALDALRQARLVAQTPPPDPSLVIELTAQLAVVAAAAGEPAVVEAELEAIDNSAPDRWAELVSAGRYAVTLGQRDVAEHLLTRAIDLAGSPPDPHGQRRLALAQRTLAAL